MKHSYEITIKSKVNNKKWSFQFPLNIFVDYQSSNTGDETFVATKLVPVMAM